MTVLSLKQSLKTLIYKGIKFCYSAFFTLGKADPVTGGRIVNHVYSWKLAIYMSQYICTDVRRLKSCWFTVREDLNDASYVSELIEHAEQVVVSLWILVLSDVSAIHMLSPAKPPAFISQTPHTGLHELLAPGAADDPIKQSLSPTGPPFSNITRDRPGPIGRKGYKSYLGLPNPEGGSRRIVDGLLLWSLPHRFH